MATDKFKKSKNDLLEDLLDNLSVNMKCIEKIENISFSNQEIEKIVSLLPTFSTQEISSDNKDDDSSYISPDNFISNILKYVVLPLFLGALFLIFSIKYFQKNLSYSYIETLFFIYNDKAEVVQIAGDFTGWRPINLYNKKDGMWELKINLKPGQYKYIFLIDGEIFLDPKREIYEDAFGNKNSVVYI
ncbi:MAG: glycogen-binding domain-containing protein [Endomicrobia bacterium]|nr:glycogen-binding domain-containing protein [Endomicrobiia bacterium]